MGLNSPAEPLEGLSMTKLIALACLAIAIAAVDVTTYTGNTPKGYVQWTVGGVVLGQEWRW
jgi:hypothetical protein